MWREGKLTEISFGMTDQQCRKLMKNANRRGLTLDDYTSYLIDTAIVKPYLIHDSESGASSINRRITGVQSSYSVPPRHLLLFRNSEHYAYILIIAKNYRL